MSKTFTVTITDEQRKIILDALELLISDTSNHQWHDIDSMFVGLQKLDNHVGDDTVVSLIGE